MRKNFVITLSLLWIFVGGISAQTVYTTFIPKEEWKDESGEFINAHGGGVLFHEGRYYWFGEHRPAKGFTTEVGVTCYSSADLMNWKYESVALSVSEDPNSDIVRGCIMERPKVIYNAKTNKFVMWFHLELKGKGYAAARAAVAVSDQVAGPYEFVNSFRINAGSYPMDWTEKQKKHEFTPADYSLEWWTAEWHEKLIQGLLFKRDFSKGQMSRDQGLYVDDDGKAYQITASEENLTLMISELSDDYLNTSGRFIRIDPGGHNEAPTMFKYNDKYWMITSGCTGWAPNEARMFSAPSIWGPWERHPNPCVGEGADKTFGGQSTFILKVQGYEDAFIFMADQWRPRSLMYSRHIWLPIRFNEKGMPYLQYEETWDLSVFNQTD